MGRIPFLPKSMYCSHAQRGFLQGLAASWPFASGRPGGGAGRGGGEGHAKKQIPGCGHRFFSGHPPPPSPQGLWPCACLVLNLAQEGIPCCSLGGLEKSPFPLLYQQKNPPHSVCATCQGKSSSLLLPREWRYVMADMAPDLRPKKCT